MTTYTIHIPPACFDQVKALNDRHRGASGHLADTIADLANDPRPTNSVPLGSPDSPVRRLLLGYYRIAYRIDEDAHTITILDVGRADTPR